MDTTLQLTVPLTTNQLADLIRRQFSEEERLRLVSLLQVEEDDEPTNDEIVENFRKDYVALQRGTLKTRPIQKVLDEL